MVILRFFARSPRRKLTGLLGMLLCLLFATDLRASAETDAPGGESLSAETYAGTGSGTPVPVLDEEVTAAVARDDLHLWVLVRGRLLELDSCGGHPHEVRLDTTAVRPRRPRRVSADEVVAMASLDDADWEDAAVELLLDDEGVTRPPRRSSSPRAPFGQEPERILSLAESADHLVVRTSRRLLRCERATARCRSGPLPIAAEQPLGESAPPSRALGSVPMAIPSLFGRWLVSARGIWLVVDTLVARQQLCSLVSGDDFAKPRRTGATLPVWAMFLPRLSVRLVRSRPELGRAETAVLVLLSFSPGRALSLSHAEQDLP